MITHARTIQLDLSSAYYNYGPESIFDGESFPFLTWKTTSFLQIIPGTSTIIFSEIFNIDFLTTVAWMNAVPAAVSFTTIGGIIGRLLTEGAFYLLAGFAFLF